MKPNISVLILTLNEEVNIANCIASLPWRSDLWVLDSGSSDRTTAIAAGMGAQIAERRFTDYAEQRNFGLGLPTGEWIVMLDADERMTPELADEIESHVASVGDLSTAMFRVRRKDMFMGRWLRRSSGYPTWFPRIFRRGCVTVERAINETYNTDGGILQLQEHLLHFPLNKGINWWFERHNHYSAAEARLLVSGDASVSPFDGTLFSRDPGKRRAALKRTAYQLPGRPYLAFLYFYILRMGFLDGRPGYHFACMRLAYELMIDAKTADLRFNGRG